MHLYVFTIWTLFAVESRTDKMTKLPECECAFFSLMCALSLSLSLSLRLFYAFVRAHAFILYKNFVLVVWTLACRVFSPFASQRVEEKRAEKASKKKAKTTSCNCMSTSNCAHSLYQAAKYFCRCKTSIPRICRITPSSTCTTERLIYWLSPHKFVSRQTVKLRSSILSFRQKRIMPMSLTDFYRLTVEVFFYICHAYTNPFSFGPHELFRSLNKKPMEFAFWFWTRIKTRNSR